MMKRNAYKADRADIDLTPMLDVVFIMLIFFIVTASFVREKTLALNSPQDHPQTSKEQLPSFVVNVDAADELTVEGRHIDKQAVQALIVNARTQSPGRSVVVRAHELSSTHTYAFIANAARGAHAGAVTLITYND